MKKIFTYVAASMMMASTISFTSCTKEGNDPNEDNLPADIEYTSVNANSWHNYMTIVAKLLNDDSQKLYSEWNNGYADKFKNPSGSNSDYKAYINCIEQIIDGSIDIAAEVGGAKLGDPYNLYQSGDKTAALYAVESWYSWHSKEDYSNNIVSIQNAYYGHRNETADIDDRSHTYHQYSMAALVKAKDEKLFEEIDQAIKNAYKAIMNIPTPFRNHIGSPETVQAMNACDVVDKLYTDRLRPFMREQYGKPEDDAFLKPVVEQYVDAVVMPTYTDLRDRNVKLLEAVATLAKNRTNENFKAACDAWISAREPWEESEACLFGPVATFGLDPNMDSWPLDQAAIVNILNSGKFDDLTWDGEFDEENEEISKKQSVRGFHTLEFLLFQDGKARTIK